MPLNPVSSGDPHVPAHNAERDAINNLETEVAKRIPLPPGAATGDLLRWDGVQWLTTETRFFEGTGRPDGVIAAPVGSRYIDKTASHGAVEWVKRLGEGNTGWLCLAGDTGLRNISGMVAKPAGSIVHVAQVRRIGHVVEMYFDLTMPTAPGSWALFGALPGFSPHQTTYGILSAHRDVADKGGTYVNANGGVGIGQAIKNARDRYQGTFLTADAWPSTLPGSAV